MASGLMPAVPGPAKLTDRVWAGFALAVALVLAGLPSIIQAADKPLVAPRLLHLSSPAPVNSHLSRLTQDQDGSLYLSWVTEEDGLAELAFARLSDQVWSEVTTISKGDDWFVNWADFPMLSAAGGNLVAHWLRRSAKGTYDYDIAARFYDASSEGWGEPRVINTDGVQAEHGFVSMSPLGNNKTLISWLDGRNTRNSPEAGPMTLRTGFFGPSGKRLNEWELDASVCDCCQTSSALTSQGPIVVYRDRSEAEVRDIAIVRFINDHWTQPAIVHQDGWQIAGCPVNGPSVAADDRRVAVAWFSAKDRVPKVQLALSSDSGETFSAPVRVAESTTNGRVDTAILSSGDVVVSWMDDAQAEAKIMLSRFDANADLIDTMEIARTSPSRRSGFPTIEAVGETVYASWTEIDSEMRVKVALVSY